MTELNAVVGSIDVDQLDSAGSIGLTAATTATVVNATGIDLKASSVGTDLTATATTGDITDSGVVSVGGMTQLNAAAGAIDVDQLNSTGSVGISSFGNANLVNAVALDLKASNVGGNLTITASAGDITQSDAATVAGTSSIHALAGSITLTDANNDFVGQVTASGNSVELVDLNELLAGDITAVDKLILTAHGINLNGVVSAETVALVSSSGVTEGPVGVVSATNLLLSGSGDFVLDNTGNDTAFIAAAVDGTLSYTDQNELTIDSLNCPGISVCGLDVSGDLNLITLNGNLSQLSDASIIVAGNTVIDTGSGDICLAGGACDGGDVPVANENRFDGMLTLISSGSVVIAENDDVAIDSVLGGGNYRFIGNNIQINTSIIATQLLLEASDGVDYNGNVIDVSDLVLIGAGQFDFGVAGETAIAVDNLAADISGDLNLVASTSVNIGDITFTSGCGDVQVCGVNIDGGGFDLVLLDSDLSQTASIQIAGATNLDVGSGTICLTGGDCTGDGVNDNDFVGTVTATGSTVELVDANSLAVGDISAIDDIYLRAGDATTGSLAIDGDLLTSSGQVLLQGDTSIVQSTTSTIRANELLVGSVVDADARAASVSLAGTNEVNNLAGRLDNSFSMNNSIDLNVTEVSYASACGTMDSFAGLSVVGGEAVLNVAGNLTLQQEVAVTGGNVLFDVDGDVTQLAVGTLSADALALIVDGNAILNNPNNDLDSIAIAASGAVEYADIDDLTVDTVSLVGPSLTLTGVAGDDDVRFVVAGDLRLDQSVVLGGDLLLDVDGNTTQSGAGQIKANGLALLGAGNTTLDNSVNSVDVFAADTTGDIVFVNSSDLKIGEVIAESFTADRAMVAINGSITTALVNVAGIQTAGNDVQLSSTGNLTFEQSVSLGAGDLSLTVTGDVSQLAAGTIEASAFGLVVDGKTVLVEANDVGELSGSFADAVHFADLNDLVLGASGIGLTTSNDDAKFTVGGGLTIAEAVALGDGDLFLDVGGAVGQEVAGTIEAAGLGLMVDGQTVLDNTNNRVSMIAAGTRETLLFVNDSDLKVGEVTAEMVVAVRAMSAMNGTIASGEMTLTGVTSSDDDVELVARGNLTMEAAVSLGAGDYFVDVAGDVTQILPGTIHANGLALVVGGNAILDSANDVNEIAADTQGSVRYTDVNDLKVSVVTSSAGTDGGADVPIEASVLGISTSDDDVKLTVGGNLTMEQFVAVGAGDFLVDVSGDVTQTIDGQIQSNGLGLMVDGQTILVNAGNQVNVLAADSMGEIVFGNSIDLKIGSIVVEAVTAERAMTAINGSISATETSIVGVTTSDDDVKLNIDGNLTAEQFVSLGDGDFWSDVAGDVTQTATGTISANGIALVVDGGTILAAANDVNVIAAETEDAIHFVDVNDLIVGEVTIEEVIADRAMADMNGSITAAEVMISGVTTSGDDATLVASGNLTFEQTVSIGDGDLFVDVDGDVTQLPAGSITANGVALVVGGETVLNNGGNDVSVFAAETQGEIVFANLGDLKVATVTAEAYSAERAMTIVNGSTLTSAMELTGITTSSDDVKLIVGGNLTTEQAVNLGDGDFFLSVRGDVTQLSTGTIEASGLGLIVDGNTVLVEANDVEHLAGSVDGALHYSDIDDLKIGVVTAESVEADRAMSLVNGSISNAEAVIVGITSADSDVKLETAGNFTLEQQVSLGDGDLQLNALGDVTQTNLGSILARGLGLRVDGETILNNSINDVVELAVESASAVQYTDANDLKIGTVAAEAVAADRAMAAMNGSVDSAASSQSGVSTSGDDVKLTVGSNLTLEQQVALGSGDLVLDVGGDLSQLAAGTIESAVVKDGTIQSDGLGLIVQGNTLLGNASNNVNAVAAVTSGAIHYTDLDDLKVGIVTAEAVSADRAMVAMNGTVEAGETVVSGVVTSDDDVKISSGGNLTLEQQVDLGHGDLVLDVAGDLTQLAAGTVEVGIAKDGTIRAAGLGLQVEGNTLLNNSGNDVDRIAANELASLKTGAVQYTDANDLTVGEVAAESLVVDRAMKDMLPVDQQTLSADETSVSGITTNGNDQADNSDDDDVKLAVGGNLTIENSVQLAAGDLHLRVEGDVTQSAGGSIEAIGLAIDVDGNTILNNTFNNVSIVAANGVAGDSLTGAIRYTDADDLVVGAVVAESVVADRAMKDMLPAGQQTVTAEGVSLAGITTQGTDVADNSDDDDVKLTVGGDLAIEEVVQLAAGDLFLDVAGNVSQTAAIGGVGLALDVDGDTDLSNAGNDFETLVANQLSDADTGQIIYTDANDLTIGRVVVETVVADRAHSGTESAAEMSLVGVSTSGDDAKLIVGGDLKIETGVSLATGDLFLDVAGNVTQIAAISGGGLGLMVDGTTTLSNSANDFVTIASDNSGDTIYRDANDLNVGTVVVAGMSVQGILVDGDLSVQVGGNLSQNSDAPVIVSGTTQLTTVGHVCWTFGDFVDGVSDGKNDNDFNLLEIVSAADADVVDRNNFTTTAATVAGQLRLAAGDETAGKLTLTGDLVVGDQILLQASDGVTQSGGVIRTDQLLIGGNLAKESTGVFDLQQANDINQLAARTVGDLSYVNSTDLNFDVLSYNSVCMSAESISGVNVDGDLVVRVDAIASVDAGHLTQSIAAAVVVTGDAALDATGDIVLLGDDRDPADGGNANDFQGVVDVNQIVSLDNVDRDFVEIADVNDLVIDNARANDGIHLFAGTEVPGLLSIDGQLASKQVLVQASGGVLQNAASSVIVAAEVVFGGDQANEGTGAFRLGGANQIDHVVANLVGGSLQLKNTNNLTVSSGLSFTGSNAVVTDTGSGIQVNGPGADLIFADPNIALSSTVQGAVSNAGERFNPAFEQFLDVSDVGVAILNSNTLTVESNAEVRATQADVYLETVGDFDLMINDTIRVDDISNRILVVAGGQLELEPEGRLERGDQGLITTRLNDQVIEDPQGNPADQNALVDRNTLTQDVRFRFADALESNFDATIFSGIEGNSDNTLDFSSLTPDRLEQLTSVIFADGEVGFESRSFYDSQLNVGGNSVTVTSQPIGSMFDTSGRVIDADATPTASFTLEFLRNNPEFRNVLFVFNDANINIFQNASSDVEEGGTGIDDLNVSTGDFEGLARFNAPNRIAIQRSEPDVPEAIEVVTATEIEPVETGLATEQPLFVQTVQQKFYVVVYFDSQFEADQFESQFGDEERDYQEVLKLLKELELAENAFEWRNASDSDLENLDANQIREILSQAGLDLDDDGDWVEGFKQWLKEKSDADDVPDVPRGVYKILEVENGKTVIQGDDIDRKFVPEPDESSGDPSGTESSTDIEPLEKSSPYNSPRGSIPDSSDLTGSHRLQRWSAMMASQDQIDSEWESAEVLADTSAIADATRDGIMGEAQVGVAGLAGLLAVIRKKPQRQTHKVDLDPEQDQAEGSANDQPRPNMFSTAARFRRKVTRRK